jgi:nucleoside-diphosphate-sugar epimerase
MTINNKKICVVTGSNGGVGKSLINSLNKMLIFDVIGLDKKECDLTTDSCKKYFQNADYIFHLACIKPSERGTTEEEYRANIKMTENVAKFNKKAKVIYASAGTIYGICDYFPIREDKEVKCSEDDWYCRGKLESENILREYSEKNSWELVILRITNIYGNDFRRKGEILPNFFEEMVRSESLKIYGGGKQKRDRIFIDDLVQALECSLKDNVSGIFNIGSGKSYSTLEVAKIMGKILKNKYKLEFPDSLMDNRKDNLLNIKKAKKVLGFKPKVSFKKGLKIVINSWKNE